MDPDRVLSRITDLAERIVSAAPQGMEWSTLVSRTEELAETILSLDEWLRRGGFLPQPWKREPGKKAP